MERRTLGARVVGPFVPPAPQGAVEHPNVIANGDAGPEIGGGL